MKRNYSYIVLGCGGIGSGTAYWLARRAGAEVLGLEQYELGHHHGGSQDYSRIIRLTYHHADYTRLTPHTYTAWATLEEESAVRIVTKTGSVELALKDGPHQSEIEIYAAAMDAAAIPYERLDSDEVMRRYPQFRLEAEMDGLFQADTGIADAIKGNAAHVAMARAYGATILDRCGVEAIQPFEGGVEVKTSGGTFSGQRLIITAGAWTDRLLAAFGLSLSLTVTPEQTIIWGYSGSVSITKLRSRGMAYRHVLVYSFGPKKPGICCLNHASTRRSRSSSASYVRVSTVTSGPATSIPTLVATSP